MLADRRPPVPVEVWEEPDEQALEQAPNHAEGENGLADNLPAQRHEIDEVLADIRRRLPLFPILGVESSHPVYGTLNVREGNSNYEELQADSLSFGLLVISW